VDETKLKIKEELTDTKLSLVNHLLKIKELRIKAREKYSASLKRYQELKRKTPDVGHF
jgi:hypothetical protein